MPTPPLAALPALALLAVAEPVAAQMTLGARGGAILGTLSVTDETGGVEGASPKWGGHGSLSVGYVLNKRIGLVAELGYSVRGAELDIKESDYRYKAIWGYNYVDATLLGKASLGPAYLLAGPSAAFRTACYTWLGDHKSSCESVGAVFREHDLLVLGGAGVRLSLGPVAVVAESLYTLGILNIDNEGVTTARHRGLLLRTGVDVRVR